MKILVYTTSFGKTYDTIPQIPKRRGAVDYLVYSDKGIEDANAKEMPDYWIRLPELSVTARPYSRVVKLNPSIITDHNHPLNWLTKDQDCHDREIDLEKYNYIVWIDSNCNIKCEEELIRLCKLVPKGSWGLFEHPDRVCAYEEMRCVSGLSYVSKSILEEQRSLYKSRGLPKKYGLFACGIIIRSITSLITHRRLWDIWLDEFLRWVPRDQVCLPYCLYSMPQARPISLGGFNYNTKVYEFSKK
jgi:hypothetical protein